MIKVLEIKPSSAQHFVYNNTEFEIRITDDGDKLEIWEVEYQDGKCIGFKDIVAEFDLEEENDESWKTYKSFTRL